MSSRHLGKQEIFAETSILKLTTLSAIISPYSIKFIEHNKSNPVLLREIVIIPSPSSFYVLQTTYVISSFNLRTECY